jgi:hypothetical protein
VSIRCRLFPGTVCLAVALAALAPACRKPASQGSNDPPQPASREVAQAKLPESRAVATAGSGTADVVVAAGQDAAPPSKDAQPGEDLLQNAPERTPDGNPIDPKARRLLARMLAAYQGAQSYEDDTEFRIVQHLHQGPLRVRFERPNKVDARIPNARIVSDGKQRTVYLEDLGQYVTSEAPDALQAERLWGETIPRERISEFGTISVPLRLMLVDNPWDYVLEGVVAVSVDSEPVEIDGRPHDVIRFDKIRDDAVLYVDQKTGLMRRLEVDITARLAAAGQPVTGKVTYMLELHNAQVDVPSRSFSYEPPAGSEKVDAFDFPKPMLPPMSEPGETTEPAEPPAKPDQTPER